jgi:hypothetical protein
MSAVTELTPEEIERFDLYLANKTARRLAQPTRPIEPKSNFDKPPADGPPLALFTHTGRSGKTSMPLVRVIRDADGNPLYQLEAAIGQTIELTNRAEVAAFMNRSGDMRIITREDLNRWGEILDRADGLQPSPVNRVVKAARKALRGRKPKAAAKPQEAAAAADEQFSVMAPPATAESFRATSNGFTTRVDRQKRIIYGVSVAEVGELADDRGAFIDGVTVAQVARLGRQLPDGAKSRVGHPGESTDELLTHLGRLKNFRVVGNAAVGDLHVAAAAKEGDWVLQMAEEDPGAFGASMIIKRDRPAESAERRRDGKVPIRLAALLAVDVVGEPAATSGLLASEFSAKRTTHLDAVNEYIDNHEAFAAVGRTLYKHVLDYFVNDRSAPEPTTAILNAVKAQSDRLHAKWMAGEVT